MIKILIVLQDSDNVDFRAYALEISERSKSLPPQAKLSLTESSQQIDTANPADLPLPRKEIENKCPALIHQIRKPLETRQIFMN